MLASMIELSYRTTKVYVYQAESELDLSSGVQSWPPLDMKRARDAPRSSIVRLNVGGRIFQTSRETLCGSAFFRSLLEHDFGTKL